MPAAQEFATAIAERCALVANRYEPEGAFTFDQLSVVEAIGAKIGDAIIHTFPPEGAYVDVGVGYVPGRDVDAPTTASHEDGSDSAQVMSPPMIAAPWLDCRRTPS
jgi:hypothetical protein